MLSLSAPPLIYPANSLEQATARTVQAVARPTLAGGMRATKRILLVDDDPGVLKGLGRVLESEHYEVIRAKTGNEAARLFVSKWAQRGLFELPSKLPRVVGPHSGG